MRGGRKGKSRRGCEHSTAEKLPSPGGLTPILPILNALYSTHTFPICYDIYIINIFLQNSIGKTILIYFFIYSCLL